LALFRSNIFGIIDRYNPFVVFWGSEIVKWETVAVLMINGDICVRANHKKIFLILLEAIVSGRMYGAESSSG
jgi:hypothetical protein